MKPSEIHSLTTRCNGVVMKALYDIERLENEEGVARDLAALISPTFLTGNAIVGSTQKLDQAGLAWRTFSAPAAAGKYRMVGVGLNSDGRRFAEQHMDTLNENWEKMSKRTRTATRKVTPRPLPADPRWNEPQLPEMPVAPTAPETPTERPRCRFGVVPDNQVTWYATREEAIRGADEGEAVVELLGVTQAAITFRPVS